MASFTITGTVDRLATQVTWTDGRIETDDPTIDAEVRALADMREEVAIAGIWSGPAGLDEHLQAVATLSYVFDPGAVIDGDEPAVEALPEGDDVLA